MGVGEGKGLLNTLIYIDIYVLNSSKRTLKDLDRFVSMLQNKKKVLGFLSYYFVFLQKIS